MSEEAIEAVAAAMYNAVPHSSGVPLWCDGPDDAVVAQYRDEARRLLAVANAIDHPAPLPSAGVEVEKAALIVWLTKQHRAWWKEWVKGKTYGALLQESETEHFDSFFAHIAAQGFQPPTSASEGAYHALHVIAAKLYLEYSSGRLVDVDHRTALFEQLYEAIQGCEQIATPRRVPEPEPIVDLMAALRTAMAKRAGEKV